MFNQPQHRRQHLRSLLASSLSMPAILAGLLNEGRAEDRDTNPLSPKEPHFAPRAKRVIFVFSNGGVSQMDTFDPKPELFAADGKKTGVGGGLSNTQRVLLKPMWEFKPGGQCGTMVSDLFPYLREKMDDICLIRSMKSDDNEHANATLAMHTGSLFFARPSIGSWVSYGLGTFNQNLPSFMVIAPKLPYAGTQVFANDFLPAYHQGTRVVPGADPIPNLQVRATSLEQQRVELDFVGELNRRHLLAHEQSPDLAARIKSFETAFHMQAEAPEAFDISGESAETLALYGIPDKRTDSFGWQCLIARRLAERGVRFIEILDGSSNDNWDQHSHMQAHKHHAERIDQPLAALITDLKQRGMLDDTLVVWTTEFGRTPGIDGEDGRGHHSACFCSWMAGGGTKGGMAYGQTDELAATVAENPVHFHDFHATILHLLGMDHTKLTYRFAGRDYRLTDVHGRVVHDLIA